MNESEFQAGALWALRPGNTLGAPAKKVKLVFLTKGRARRCKVRHVESELQGLEEFVHLGHLRCPWKDWTKVARDEANELRLIAHADNHGEIDKVVLQAAQAILQATGEDVWIEDHRGYTRWNEGAALQRIAERAGSTETPWRRPPAFRNRDGHLYVPNEVLLDLALTFAKAEPETVHLHLEIEEQQLLREGFVQHDPWAHATLLKAKPSFAVARHWAGGAQEHHHLLEELSRLQELVRKAARELELCGAGRKAQALERSLGQVRHKWVPDA